MAIDVNKHKVSDSEIAENQLQGKKNPLKGKVEDNQKMFDNLPKKAIQKHNQFVEAVVEEFQTVTSSVENQIKDVNAELDKLSDETQKELKDKVDKEEGKGLSTNDFANEYKNKLDNLDRTISEEVERVSNAVDDLSDEFDSYKEDATLKLNLKADKTTTDDLQRQVNNKADKSDITSVYRFRGSVEKYEYLLPLVDVAEGDVYNVIEDGMNYAWTGSTWDALGGEHIDTKARDDIDALKLVVRNEVPKAIRDSVMPLEKKDALIREEIAELSKNVETKVDKTTVDDLWSQVNKKADATTVYTRAETNALLANKVNKEDIVSAYKFCGSVDKFEDLPHRYALIPNIDIEKGIVPTLNGQPLSGDLWEYNEDTGEITLKDVPVDAGYEGITIPIVPIHIVAGKYYTTSTYYGDAFIGDLCTYECGAAGDTYVELKAQTIDHIEVFSVSGDAVSGTTDHLGYLDKITDSWLTDECLPDLPIIPSDAFDNGNVYNVVKGGMNYAWTGTEWDALGGEHRDIEARADIDKLETEMKKKANKEDVVSAYRFCGSVNKFDDLPVRYALIPNGVPTYKGEPCGTYDEKTHTVTVDDVMLEDFEDRIIVPIVPIEVKAGKYFCYNINKFGNAIIGDLDTYMCGAGGGGVYETLTEGTISHIEIFTPYGEEIVGGSTNKLGSLDKIIDSWIGEYDIVDGNIPTGAYDAGAIYEVKESGLSYGWTGSSWDALGTSHIDQEARAQIGDIETALDSIIEIQNSLIGGETV